MRKGNCTKNPIVESDDECNFGEVSDDEWTDNPNQYWHKFS